MECPPGPTARKLGIPPTPFLRNCLAEVRGVGGDAGRQEVGGLSFLTGDGRVLVLNAGDEGMKEFKAWNEAGAGAAPRAHAWSDDGRLLAVGTASSLVLLGRDAGWGVVARFGLYFHPTNVSIGIVPGSSDPKGVTEKFCRLYLVAVCGADGVHIFRYPKADLPPRVIHESLHICVLDFARNGSALAVGAMDSHIGVWRITEAGDPTDLWYSFLGTELICSLSFAADGDNLAAGFWDGTVIVFRRAVSGAWERVVPLAPYAWSHPRANPAAAPTLVRFAPNGHFLCFVSGAVLRVCSVDLGHAILTKKCAGHVKGLATGRSGCGVWIYTRSGVLEYQAWPALAADMGVVPQAVRIGMGARLLLDHTSEMGIGPVKLEIRRGNDVKRVLNLPFLQTGDVLPHVYWDEGEDIAADRVAGDGPDTSHSRGCSVADFGICVREWAVALFFETVVYLLRLRGRKRCDEQQSGTWTAVVCEGPVASVELSEEPRGQATIAIEQDANSAPLDLCCYAERRGRVLNRTVEL